MKIGFTGIDLPEGKIKYIDPCLVALEKKDNPKKVVPYFVEFVKNEFAQVDAVVIPKEQILDLLIFDMEKVDTLTARGVTAADDEILKKCVKNLEREIPICDIDLTENEKNLVKTLSFLSFKPVVILDNKDMEVNDIIKMILDKAGYMFFYTTGPKESHAWIVKKNSDIVTCAGKIHTDLARGFIRGDVVSFEDYMKCHNFNDCKAKNLVRVVEKDYILQPNEIIEIRFNV